MCRRHRHLVVLVPFRVRVRQVTTVPLDCLNGPVAVDVYDHVLSGRSSVQLKFDSDGVEIRVEDGTRCDARSRVFGAASQLLCAVGQRLRVHGPLLSVEVP